MAKLNDPKSISENISTFRLVCFKGHPRWRVRTPSMAIATIRTYTKSFLCLNVRTNDKLSALYFQITLKFLQWWLLETMGAVKYSKMYTTPRRPLEKARLDQNLKLTVYLSWLFDLVLHSSLDDLVWYIYLRLLAKTIDFSNLFQSQKLKPFTYIEIFGVL